MNHPRFQLAALPTPLQRAERLEHALDHPYPIFVKRDDLTGFGAAGNKARSLEFLLGDALDTGRDTLVTGGGPGSNYLAGAALAARAAGLACELIVPGDPAGSPNLELARRAGATIHPLGHHDRSRVDSAVVDLATRLATTGRQPYPAPRGGSTPVGALGFAHAATELSEQLGGMAVEIVLAVGSGGSCAGLLAGIACHRLPWRVLAVSVSRPVPEIEAKVHRLAACCADLLGAPPPDPAAVRFVDGRGPGFGAASDVDRAAARLALETEGLLLDATYTAKALAVLVAHEPGRPVVFWHTGGLVTAIAEYVTEGAVRERACERTMSQGGRERQHGACEGLS